jgi:hypothetical protein
MQHNLYTIRDDQAESFGPIFQSQNHGTARRIVMESAPETLMGKYSSDFSLWHVGVFDDQTSEVEGSVPSKLATLSQILNKEEK